MQARDGRTTFAAGAHPVTASVPRGTAPAMDVESLAVATMHGMHAILSVP